MRAHLLLPLLAACTPDTPDIVQRLPEITVAPALLAFGERVSPLPHEEALLVGNAGLAELEVALSLEDATGAFSLPVATARIDAKDSLAIPVRFLPPTFLAYEAELVLTTNDVDDPTIRIPVSGTGISGPLPDIDVDPRTVDFEEVTGEATRIVTVRNAGTAPLQLGAVTQQGSGAFELLTDPSNTTVAAGNELPVVVRYAPAGEAGDSGALTFVSDDPDEPEVEVLLLGNGGGDFAYPEAVINCPSAEVDPPSFVSLSGLGSSDPSGALPLTYAWTLLERPEDVDGNPISDGYLTSPSGDTTRLWADAVGTYVVQLVVTNALGVRSAPARCTVEAKPKEALLVELTWNTPRADLDLHLARNGVGVFRLPDDVSWCNRNPSWGSADQSPRLDLDDRAGGGPENISTQAPADGSYVLRVHYFDDGGDDTVTATVRVYIDQALALQTSRNLTRDQVWDVAEVRWPARTAAALSGDPATAPRRQCFTP